MLMSSVFKMAGNEWNIYEGAEILHRSSIELLNLNIVQKLNRSTSPALS
jgi:hypothetical protein